MTPSEWALGIQARVRALLSEGEVADRLYRESIDWLGRARARVELEAFAGRAGRELRATGETVRKRTVESSDALTAQEALIARLARDGLSNPVGTRLFISPRTVQYHLGKVFTKLDVSSRALLDRVLPGDPATARPVWPAGQSPRCRATTGQSRWPLADASVAGANETWRAAGTVSRQQLPRRSGRSTGTHQRPPARKSVRSREGGSS